MMDEIFLARNTQCLSRIDNNKCTVVPLHKRCYQRLNKPGTDFLTLCDGSRSLGDIVTCLREIYDISREELLTDLYLFMRTLLAQNLIRGSSSPVEKIPPLKEYKGICPPQIVDWQITRDCSCNCIHCYQDRTLHNKAVSLDLALRIIEDISSFPVVHVAVTGGEPFTVSHIDEILIALGKTGCVVTVSTNGSLINQRHVDIFKEYKISVQVSVDGIGHHHDTIRRFPGLFERVSQNIQMLADAGVDTTVAFCVTRGTCKEIEKVCTYAQYCFLIDTDYKQSVKSLLSLIPTTPVIMEVGTQLLVFLKVVSSEATKNMIVMICDMKARGIINEVRKAHMIFEYKCEYGEVLYKGLY